MSTLAEQIAREHAMNSLGGCIACATGGDKPTIREEVAEYALHVAAVTEQAVRERIAAQIEAVSLDGLAIHANTAQENPMGELLAFDPGGTTGYAVVDLETYEVVESGQFKDWRSIVPDLIYGQPCEAIAYESFILRRGAYTSDQIDPVYVIGAIESWAKWEHIPTHQYPPSTTKQVTDEVLERLGWLITPKTPNRHANDALRVVACYLRETQDMEFIERAWPK